MVLLEILAVVGYLHYRQHKKVKRLEAALQNAGVPVPPPYTNATPQQQRQWQGDVRVGGVAPQREREYYEDDKKVRGVGEEWGTTYYTDEKNGADIHVDEKHPAMRGPETENNNQYNPVNTVANTDTKDTMKSSGMTKMDKFDDWVDLQLAKGRESLRGYVEKGEKSKRV